MGKYTTLIERYEWSLGGSFNSHTKKDFDTLAEAEKYLKEDFFSNLESCKQYIRDSFHDSGHEYIEPEYKDDEERGFIVYYEGKSNHAYISEYYLDEDSDEAKIVYHSCNDNASIKWSILVENIKEDPNNDPILICKHCGKILEDVYSMQICNRICYYHLEHNYGETGYDFNDDDIDVKEHLGFYCNNCDNEIDKEQEVQLYKKYRL